mgnify:CR=1 FL=1
MRKKIIVRGPVLSRSGYGEQARFALRSLRNHEDRFDIFLINTQWGGTGWTAQNDEERQYIDFLIQKTFHWIANEKPFDMSLQITIPNEWERLAPINIGYTAGIETTKIAPQWIEKSNLMDKIIVTSTHSRNTLVNTSYDLVDKETQQPAGKASVMTPVEAVGYPVKSVERKKLKLDLEADFNFLMVSQWGPRKNADNTVKWFIEKFKDNPDVGLVIKAFVSNNSTMDGLHTEARVRSLIPEGTKCKIYLLHGDMSDKEMSSLYTHPKIKCLVSLSHGEGWGLPLFEASYVGLPIITTVWSGQADFLSMPSKQRKKGSKSKMETVFKPSCGDVSYSLAPVQTEAVWDGVIQADSMWCYPEEESYKSILGDVLENYGKYEDMSKKLKTWVRKEFDADKQHEAFANAVYPAQEIDEPKVVNFD